MGCRFRLGLSCSAWNRQAGLYSVLPTSIRAPRFSPRYLARRSGEHATPVFLFRQFVSMTAPCRTVRTQKRYQERAPCPRPPSELGRRQQGSDRPADGPAGRPWPTGRDGLQAEGRTVPHTSAGETPAATGGEPGLGRPVMTAGGIRGGEGADGVRTSATRQPLLPGAPPCLHREFFRPSPPPANNPASASAPRSQIVYAVYHD